MTRFKKIQWPKPPEPKVPQITEDEQKSCLDKRYYGSEQAAHGHAQYLAYRSLSVYKCRFCNGWHLTSH